SMGMGSTATHQSAEQLTETNAQAAYVGGYITAGQDDKAQGGLQGAVDQVREKAGELGSQVQEKASEAGSYVREKVQQWTGQETEQWDSRRGPMRTRSDYRPARRGGSRRRSLQRNPLSFGLATLAVGALFGLALPATKTENRLLGETRNQLFDSAQNVAQDVKQRVQQAVDHASADLQQTAQQTADNVKQTVKDAASDINHMNAGTTTRASY
ncbi:MAG: hypothetical protein M3Q45_09170, partial [Chloroflexota bacterium]|nr:hypothetical protein [Chloroflexota bacterium]